MSQDLEQSPDLVPEEKIGALDLLRIRDFRMLWLGQIVSNFGDALTALATLLLIYHLTGSKTSIAIVAITQAIPRMTIGLVAGVYVDRLDRRKIMIVSDIVRALLVLSLVTLATPNETWFGYFLKTPDKIWYLYLISFLQSSVSSFFMPARMAYVPLIVPKRALLTANSLGQTSMIIMGVLGAGAAGWIIDTFGTYWPAFVIDSATYGLSALFILQVRTPSGGTAAAKANVREIVDEMGAGFEVIGGSRILIGVLVATAVAMLGMGMVNVLLIPLVVDELGVPETWFAILQGSQTVSMVLGAALLTVVAARVRATRIVSVALIAIGIVVGFVSQVTNVWQLMLLLFLAGWFVAPLQASLSTLLQLNVADELRGRASAALSTASQTASVLSMAVSGLMADAIGVRGVFVIGGAITVLAGIASILIFKGQAGEPALPQAADFGPEPDEAHE